MLHLLFDAPYASREQMQLLSAQLEARIGKCGAKVTWGELARGTLLNLGVSYAMEGFGWALGRAAQGLPPALTRFLADEEGGSARHEE